MKREKSCGAVVFTRVNGEVKFVIVRSLEGFCGFPKGHVETGETEEDTARREIMEEVGLKVDQFIPGFREIDEHTIPNKPGVMKQIVYFLAEYQNQEIKYQPEELIDASLMTYEEALANFKWDGIKRILQAANEQIKQG